MVLSGMIFTVQIFPIRHPKTKKLPEEDNMGKTKLISALHRFPNRDNNDMNVIPMRHLCLPVSGSIPLPADIMTFQEATFSR